MQHFILFLKIGGHLLGLKGKASFVPRFSLDITECEVVKG